jgi:23S rRNA (pseudouridine1915-N3)-methyltransferase
MKWLIATIGKPRLEYARLGIDDYLQRSRRFAEIELVALKGGSQSAEGAALLERTAGCHRIVLDERGERPTSAEFAKMIDTLQLAGTRRVALLVGGADGHSPEVRSRADRVLSLSPLTLQHELALVVLLEQIYRGYSILRGTPYHRE